MRNVMMEMMTIMMAVQVTAKYKSILNAKVSQVIVPLWGICQDRLLQLKEMGATV